MSFRAAAVALFSILASSATFGAERIVWQIGKPDHDYSEFAFAADYPAYARDVRSEGGGVRGRPQRRLARLAVHSTRPDRPMVAGAGNAPDDSFRASAFAARGVHTPHRVRRRSWRHAAELCCDRGKPQWRVSACGRGTSEIVARPAAGKPQKIESAPSRRLFSARRRTKSS